MAGVQVAPRRLYGDFVIDRTDRIDWKPGLLAAALGFLAFGLCLLNDFVYDDHIFVRLNHWIRSWDNLWALLADPRTNAEEQPGIVAFWRPLRNVSFLIDYTIAGVRPAWYHFVNLIWHGAAAAGLYGLLRRLNASVYTAFVAAALFAVHPVQTESVAWVKERDGLMAGAFLFWALFHAAGRSGFRGGILSLLLAACSMLSKESGVVYVPLLAGICLYKNGWPFARRCWCLLGAAGALAFVFLLVRSMILGGTAQVAEPIGGTYPATLWTMPGVFARYAGLAVLPVQSQVTYEWILPAAFLNPLSILGAALLVGIIAGIVLLRRRAPLGALGLFWFLAALVPFAHFAPMMIWMAERFLYIPIAGAMIAVAVAIEVFADERRLSYRGLPLRHAIAGVLLFAAAFTSAMRTLDWRNDLTLWGHNYEVRSTTPYTIAVYAEHLAKWGDYERALEVAEGYPEDFPKYRRFAARARIEALIGLERKKEALAAARAFVEEGGVDPRVYLLLGALEADGGNFRRAIDAFESALGRDPFSRDALRNLVLLYEGANDSARAAELRARLRRIEQRPRREWRP